MRIEIQFSEDDQVGILLQGLPRGQRSKIVRMILQAALVPGGWAHLANTKTQAMLRNSDTVPAVKPVEESESAPSGPSMSPAARTSFREALQQFGTDLSGNG